MQLAEHLHADAAVVNHGGRRHLVQPLFGELKEDVHLRLRSLEVVGAEGVHAEALDAQREGPLEHLEQLLGSELVPPLLP